MRLNNNSKLLVGCMLMLAVLLLNSCSQPKQREILNKFCGSWESVGYKPNLVIFKEGDQYKLTLFKRSGITRRINPETYLVIEENDKIFINTGFRIDMAYNETTDVLTFSSYGDYTRVSINNKSKAR